jgi:hypothetical protein
MYKDSGRHQEGLEEGEQMGGNDHRWITDSSVSTSFGHDAIHNVPRKRSKHRETITSAHERKFG